MHLTCSSLLEMFAIKGIQLLKISPRNLILQEENFYKLFRNEGKVSFSSTMKFFENSNALKIRSEFLAQEKKKYEDTFGNIEAFESKFQRLRDDPEDIKEYQRENLARGKTLKQYINEIQMYLNKHDYKSALNTLEIDMVNDGIKSANTSIYNMLISYNAQIGDLKEAYRLYTNYKKKGGQVNGGMYTLLFNACANCDNSFLAMNKIEAVKEYLRNDNNMSINITHYNAMIKAYARHGELGSCLKILDEVLERKDKIKVNTYGYLLEACLFDKNSGFRHALILWRKILQIKMIPNLYLFQMILRCARDCSFGEVELLEKLIMQIQKESKTFFKRKIVYKTVGNEKKRIVCKISTTGNNLLPSQSPSESEISEKKFVSESELNSVNTNVKLLDAEESEAIDNVVQTTSENNNCGGRSDLPNLLALNPDVGSVISFGVMTEPHHRFLCLGGLKGFLSVMSDFKVDPDIKIFTLLIDLVEPNLEAEEEIMTEARRRNIKLDIAFFNALLKKRNIRGEYSSIQEALNLMQKEGVTPDIITFGILAHACNTYEAGMELIESARCFGFRLNMFVLRVLLFKAGLAQDMKYVKAVMRVTKEEKIEPDEKFIAYLSKIVKDEKRRRKESANENSNFDEIN